MQYFLEFGKLCGLQYGLSTNVCLTFKFMIHIYNIQTVNDKILF